MQELKLWIIHTMIEIRVRIFFVEHMPMNIVEISQQKNIFHNRKKF
jgi:hypothetical protein